MSQIWKLFSLLTLCRMASTVNLSITYDDSLKMVSTLNGLNKETSKTIVRESIQLGLDYLTWRNLKEAIFLLQGSINPEVKDLFRCSGNFGFSISVTSFTSENINKLFKIRRNYLGVVVYLDDMTKLENLLQMANRNGYLDPSYRWLVVVQSDVAETLLSDARKLDLSFSSDVVVAFRFSEVTTHRNVSLLRSNELCVFADDTSISICEHPENYGLCLPSENIKKKRSYGKFMNIMDLNLQKTYRAGKDLKSLVPIEATQITKYRLTQFYKIRKEDNSSLISKTLGLWDIQNGTLHLHAVTETPARNMHGFPISLGTRNVSVGELSVYAEPDPSYTTTDERSDNYENLLETALYISTYLNATTNMVSFSKLGYQNHEGSWTDMLGAVMSDDVDLGVENVIMTYERAESMDFTYPILHSMRNIYLRLPDTRAMRDIYLLPFSSRLFISVFSTGLILSLVVILITRSGSFCTKQLDLRHLTHRRHDQEYKYSLGDTLIWSVSILCMQGSTWRPCNPSGKLVLLLSLLFALVIYNAYAAYITSVLSVRTTSIRSVDDVLSSGFRVGYVRSGQDEAYLRVVKDSQLREIYLQGFVKSAVADPGEGLANASRDGFAFFSTAHIARRYLRTMSPESRCRLSELPLVSTKTAIGYPMSKRSPYKQVVNLSVMRMLETGVLNRIRSMMLPTMPMCEQASAFNSAQVSDVYSAFVFLAAAACLSVALGLLECLWYRRSLVKRRNNNSEGNDFNLDDLKLKKYWKNYI